MCFLLILLILTVFTENSCGRNLNITGNTTNEETGNDIDSCQVARTMRQSCGHPTNVTEGDCLMYGCCWDPTHDELEGIAHCYHRSAGTVEFHIQSMPGELFCPEGHYQLGDANADGYADQFCFNETDGQLQIAIRPVEDNGDTEVKDIELHGCLNRRKLLGDVNGDDRVDIVCVTETGGIMVWLDKPDNPNLYDSEPWEDVNVGFCINQTNKVLLSDFTGDGLADLLCSPSEFSQIRSLAAGDASGTFRAAIEDPNFIDYCTEENSELKPGDFDNDKRSDLVCRVNGGKKYQIALTAGDGLLVNEDFKIEDSWCLGTNDSFLVGDINGDHHDSWICHHSDGRLCTRYNTLIFGDANMFAEENCEDTNWCKTGGLVVKDVNNDGKDDIACHEQGGNNTVAVAVVTPPTVNFVQTDWSSDTFWGKKFCMDKELYAVDANGDNKEDVVCHEDKGGLVQRMLGNSYGQLIYESMWKSDESSSDVFRFCHRDHQHPEYPKLATGDVNGDKRTDMLCLDPLTGHVTVSYPDESGIYRNSAPLITGFCAGEVPEIFPADFDGNGKLDLLCRTENIKKLWLQDPQELNGHSQTGRDVLVTLENTWCDSRYDEVLTGSFISEHTTDFLCYNIHTGSVQFASSGLRFGKQFTAKTIFCSHYGSDLQVYDANGDGYDDLTCHTSTGIVTISESHIVQQTCYDGHAWEAPPVWRLGDKPVAYFPFDAIDCFTLKSRKIRQANPRESLTTGVMKKALILDRTQRQWADLGSVAQACITSPDLCTDDGASVSFWVKFGDAHDRSTLVSTFESSVLNGQHGEYIGPSNSYFLINEGLGNIIGAVTYVYADRNPQHTLFRSEVRDLHLDNIWTHIVLVYDTGNSTTLYVNGTESDPVSHQYDFWPDKKTLTGSGEVAVGRSWIGHNQFNYGGFAMDELTFWNRKLTPTEVRAIYNMSSD